MDLKIVNTKNFVSLKVEMSQIKQLDYIIVG